MARLFDFGLWSAAVFLPTGWLLKYWPVPRRWDLPVLRDHLIALHLGIFLLAVPVALYVVPSPAQSVHWITYPFMDKRWLFALYWLALGTFLVLPRAVNFFLREAPPNSPSPATQRENPPLRRPALARWALAAAAALLSSYFAGPPWNLHRLHRGIDFHEQVHLGPLQAIDKGYLPYIGPASTQYGAGSQLLTYALVRRSGQFDIVGYRNAGAAVHWMATFLVFLIALLALPLPAAALAILFAECYSPLRLYYWESAGSLSGFYGWGNALRYMGVLVVAAGLPFALRRAWAACALGFAWGLFSWISQENLSATIAMAVLFLTLLWLSRSCPAKLACKAAAALAAGFVLFWIPVLAYYASKGAAAEFLRCYFLVPSAVVQGFSNTFWTSGSNDPQYLSFVLTTPFLIALGFCALLRFAPFSHRSPLDASQTRFLAFLSALAACYGAALFRSDSTHMVNTMIAMPFVLALALVELPSWIAAHRRAQWILRAAVLGAACLLYPLAPLLTHPFSAILQPPLWRFQSVAAPAATPLDSRPPIVRATPALADEPAAFDGGWPMRELLEELSGVREIIGSRPTYIEGYPRAFVGLIYFLLDATPAPYLLDKNMMEINRPLREEAMAYYRAHVRESKCLISPNPVAPETIAFLEAYPDAEIFDRKIGKRAYKVYVAR